MSSTSPSSQPPPPPSAVSDEAKLIKQAKKKLRQEIATKLSQLSATEVEQQSKQVHERLFALTEFRSAQRVGLYLSLPGCEIDTVPILERCFKEGKQCFVPKYKPKTKLMEFVELYSMEDFEQLPVEPKWQIKQPDPLDTSRPEALSTGGLDILLMPGVAFTLDGHRLGHGAGYFDTWLAKCAKTPNITQPKKWALSLTPQIVQELPYTDWDVLVDKIIAP